MGDCLSPGMTILTCAWMEREWMEGMAPLDCMFFRGCRYMDDVLLFTSKAADWDRKKFIEDFQRSECYWYPLRLEETDASQFLENTIVQRKDDVAYRLKNLNETGCQVWRYHDYRSRMDYATKRATITAALKKANKLGSDDYQIRVAGICKCREFLALRYPAGILRHLCRQVAFSTGNFVWLDVAHAI